MTYERTAMNKLNKSIWLSDVYIKQGIAFSVDTQQLKKRKFDFFSTTEHLETI